MKTIKELFERLGLFYRLESAIVAELEELNARIYALEENRKLKDGAILVLQKEVGELKLALRHHPVV